MATRDAGASPAPPVARRDRLNEFLQHAAKLGSVAPTEYAAARTFLARAHTPIANAGWQWWTGLGWTVVSAEQMRHFVSAQTYALRNFAARRPGPDRFGFAWAPNNATAMPQTAFVAQSGQLIDRLGVALSDSGNEWRLDPGMPACTSLGLDLCNADIEGASFTDAWRIFSVWDSSGTAASRTFRRINDRVRDLVLRERRR